MNAFENLLNLMAKEKFLPQLEAIAEAVCALITIVERQEKNIKDLEREIK